METLKTTVLHAQHLAAGAQMVEFGGWDMPIQYPLGILQEHLATRKHAGLFDVSHMGRFLIRGGQATAFLQFALTNDAALLRGGLSHYTILANANGGALDDAYLYRFTDDEYLLVVNASNRAKDWAHLTALTQNFADVTLTDQTADLAMLSLQGPQTRDLLAGLLTGGALPEAKRNALSRGEFESGAVWLARTGYTGEPVGFEIFLPAAAAAQTWDRLIATGATPIGLGARDTLRLEANLPLYGHELGCDADGRDIPILAVGSSRFGVNLTSARGDFLGKAALVQQARALEQLKQQDDAARTVVPRRVRPFAITGKGIARDGCPVYVHDKFVGYVTSGTMVPFWQGEGAGDHFTLTAATGKRALGLALIDSDLPLDAPLAIEIRGKRTSAVLVTAHLRPEASQVCRALTYAAP